MRSDVQLREQTGRSYSYDVKSHTTLADLKKVGGWR